MKLPEKTEGPWVTSFDPLTLQWRYTVDYNVSYAEDSPFFHALGQRQAARQRVQDSATTDTRRRARVA